MEDTPLEERVQEPYEDEKGLIYPGVNKVIDRVSANELRIFIEQSIVSNTDQYQVDKKNHIIYKNDF